MAIGNFDGLHIGHQRIIKQAQKLAEKKNAACAVFTFQNHPLSVINQRLEPEHIYSRVERNDILSALKVDILIEVAFTAELAQKKPGDFVRLLQESVSPDSIVVGENFTFGAGAEGNAESLKNILSGFGCFVDVVRLVYYDGVQVSSTFIRQLIRGGDLPRIKCFSGRDYLFYGKVVHGEKRGRTIGFPTANFAIEPGRAMLPDGVYAVKAEVNSIMLYGLANIGRNPTFGSAERRLEVHLLNFSADIYGSMVRISFIEKLREEEKFDSAEALLEQIKADKSHAEKIFSVRNF